MSKFLQDALKASLEAEENTETTVSEVLAEVATSDVGEGSSAADLVAEVASTGDVTGVLDNIANAAITTIQPQADGMVANEEPAPTDAVAVESLGFALTSVLASHGVKVQAASLESGSVDERAQRIGSVANNASVALFDNLHASVESFGSGIRTTISSNIGMVNKSRAALAAAISKINANSKQLEETGVTLNLKGIYDFLHRGDNVELQLKDVLKEDIKFLKDLKAALGEFSKHYTDAITKPDADTEEGVQRFARALSLMDFRSVFGKFEGHQLLHNGEVVVHDASWDGETEMMAMEVEYKSTKNDGSKNTVGQRAWGALKSGGWTAAAGGWMGGGVGLLVGFPVAGAVAGAAIAGAKGIDNGIKKADHKMRGSNTDAQNSVADVLSFLKDGLEICDMTKDLTVLLANATNDDSKARGYMKVLLEKVENKGALAVGALNVVSALGVALINSRSGGRTAAPLMKTEKQRLKESVTILLDNAEVGYFSMLEVITSHMMVCAKGAMQVSEVMVKSIDK